MQLFNRSRLIAIIMSLAVALLYFMGTSLLWQLSVLPFALQQRNFEILHGLQDLDFSGYAPYSSSFVPPVGTPDVHYLQNQSFFYDYCWRHHLAADSFNNTRNRQIVDLVLFQDDFDDLEVRLGQLFPYVDRFVVIELDYTFDGRPKPLNFFNNYKRQFKAFEPKITTQRALLGKFFFQFRPTPGEARAAIANWTSGWLMDSLVERNLVHDGDVVLYGKTNELPRPDALMTMRYCTMSDTISLEADRYQYSYQYRAVDKWQHPQAFVHKADAKQVNLTALRHEPSKLTLPNSAWYYEYCVSTFRELVTRAIGQLGMRKPNDYYMGELLKRARYGKRAIHDPPFFLVAPNRDVPDFVAQNRNYLRHLFDRTPPNANFKDLPADGNYSSLHWPA